MVVGVGISSVSPTLTAYCSCTLMKREQVAFVEC